MSSSKKCTSIILAGGKNERMGTHKAFLKFNDIFSIEILINLLKEFSSEIIIVTNNKSIFKSINNVKIVEDKISHKGPLSGIFYGLCASNNIINFVASCDAPFINKDLIQYLLNIAYENFNDFEAIVPYVKDRFQPLFAIYLSTCIPFIDKTLKKDNYRVISFYPEINVKKVDEEEIKKIDPELKSFININTPEEYQDALSVAETHSI